MSADVPSYLDDPNFRALAAYYAEHPIALYVGAGVSYSDDPDYGVGLWDKFIEKILVSAPEVSPVDLEEFKDKLPGWTDSPWQMADWVVRKVGVETFRKQVTALVQKQKNFQTRYKLLSGDFLRHAGTLNAVDAFCGAFAGGRLVQTEKGASTAIYQRAVNHRVRAVVTSNYDPFLEAGSATMYRKPILKPVAAHGSSIGSLEEIPVFHIHGYVPFPYRFRKQKTSPPIPFVDPVITTVDYEAAWKMDDAYNFTMGPQIHLLRHSRVLFIGFSFRDAWVNRLLKNLNKENMEREDRLYHYAILSQAEVAAKGIDYFVNELGVKPIAIGDFSQVKSLLSHLYQGGLRCDHPGEVTITLPFHPGRYGGEAGRPVVLTPGEYFDELYACRLCMVRKKKK